MYTTTIRENWTTDVSKLKCLECRKWLVVCTVQYSTFKCIPCRECRNCYLQVQYSTVYLNTFNVVSVETVF